MINVRGKEMMLIEAHAHVWDKIHGRRFNTASNTPIGYGKTRIGDEVVQFLSPEFVDCRLPIEVLQGYEEILGFDKCVLLQTPCYGEQYEYLNKIIEKNPEKYVTVGVPNPQDRESYLQTAKLCFETFKNYKGLKFESPDIPFKMAAPENAFVFETLMKYDKYFVLDLGWGQGAEDYPIDDLLVVAKRYPDLKIILPHLGISHMWDPKESRTHECLKKTLSILDINENVWFDMSGLPMLVRAYDEYPYPSIVNRLKAVKEFGAIDRVMWGTDEPTALVACTYQQHLDLMTKHCDFLSDDELENILGKTADKVWFQST